MLNNPTNGLWRGIATIVLTSSHPPAHLHVCAVTCITEISLIITLREQPFDFYGGGGRKTSQKKIPALVLGEKNSPAFLRKLFCTANLFSHSETCFRTPSPPFAVQNLLFALHKLFHSLQKLHYVLWKWLFAWEEKSLKSLLNTPPPNSWAGRGSWTVTRIWYEAWFIGIFCVVSATNKM